MVKEMRVPVPTPLQVMESGCPIEPFGPKVEYFVLEVWSDLTVRHPTTGVVVTAELWMQNPEAAMHILRTGGR
jgi:hypothetical protein